MCTQVHKANFFATDHSSQKYLNGDTKNTSNPTAIRPTGIYEAILTVLTVFLATDHSKKSA